MTFQNQIEILYRKSLAFIDLFRKPDYICNYFAIISRCQYFYKVMTIIILVMRSATA